VHAWVFAAAAGRPGKAPPRCPFCSALPSRRCRDKQRLLLRPNQESAHLPLGTLYLHAPQPLHNQAGQRGGKMANRPRAAATAGPPSLVLAVQRLPPGMGPQQLMDVLRPAGWVKEIYLTPGEVGEGNFIKMVSFGDGGGWRIWDGTPCMHPACLFHKLHLLTNLPHQPQSTPPQKPTTRARRS